MTAERGYSPDHKLVPLCGLQAYAPQHAAAAAVALQREQPQAHEGSPAQDYGPCLAIVPVSPSNEVGQQFTSFSGAVQEAANPSESEMAQLAIMPVGDGQVAAPDDEQGKSSSLVACLTSLGCFAEVEQWTSLHAYCMNCLNMCLGFLCCWHLWSPHRACRSKVLTHEQT